MIGIYLHIPYCRTLCPYCDFVKKRSRGVPDEFVGAVCREIRMYDGPRVAGSVFLGGGTPSLLSSQQLDAVMNSLRDTFALEDPEVTVEANPDDIAPALLRAWRDAGINRVSLGVQSFDDSTLQYLGRRHDAASAITACDAIAAEFDNWNIDLIFGARQKASRTAPRDERETDRIVAAWAATLGRALQFNPPHVATYGLTFEPNTPFERRADEALDEEIALMLYRMAEAALVHFDHYEVSNFARPGFQSRHNLIYWHNREYAGFGPGAYSFARGQRARNLHDIEAYLATPGERIETLDLSQDEIRVETLIQHFRLRDGIQKRAYADRFGEEVSERFRAQLDLLLHRGLIEENDATLRPTREGFYLNNEIGLMLVE